MKAALLYLAGISAAEVATIFLNPQWGIICHAIILTALIFHSSLVAGQPVHKLLLSLTLAPLTRILSLSMPLIGLPQIYWYPIIYAPLLVASFVVIRSLNLRAEEIGLVVRKLPLQLLIALTGVVLGVVEYLILRPQPIIAELTLGKVWLPALILLLSTGFVEELIFRGVLQRVSREVLGCWDLVYVSLLFALLHIIHLSAVDLAFVFGIALLFSWMVEETGSLLGVTLSHGLTNILLYLVLPFFPNLIPLLS